MKTGHNNQIGSDTPDAASDTGRVRTLADLARLAGVSAGTVSRALAGKSLVNAETRERIQSLARKHGFRPNQMASKLRSRRTGVIGVVIPLGHEKRQNISDPFFLTLLGHLADELTENGYDLMLSRAIPDGTSEWLERVTASGMVDGVIVIGQSDQYDAIEAVSRDYRPMVTWGIHREGQNHCAVGTDNYLGGRIATEHLIAQGASKIAFLGETRSMEIFERHRGACSAAHAAGIDLVHIPISLANSEMGAQIKAAMHHCDEGINGVFAGSDLIAINVLHCLFENGRQCPQDIKLVGFDDLPVAALTRPPLTTVRQEVAVAAKEMVQRLKLLIDGEHVESLTLTPLLVVRETTGID